MTSKRLIHREVKFEVVLDSLNKVIEVNSNVSKTNIMTLKYKVKTESYKYNNQSITYNEISITTNSKNDNLTLEDKARVLYLLKTFFNSPLLIKIENQTFLKVLFQVGLTALTLDYMPITSYEEYYNSISRGNKSKKFLIK